MLEPHTNALFSQNLRSLIINYEEPFLIKNILNWSILKWDLDKWSEILRDEELDVRCGKYKHTMEPQWERYTKEIKKTFKEFCNFDVKDSKEWLYFDYKYLNQNLRNKREFLDSISWETFGFPEFNSEESTLWIGTEGAHTPCHKDTYGCNLVAQVYGRKRWITFPPQENLHSTRIPYEESSIYSKLNFFAPNDLQMLQNLKHCKSIILEPGDVLFMPNGWWHYVENLEIAISINIWIPLPTDPQRQLEESLVQMLVAQFIKDMNINKQQAILNPNMEKLNLPTQDIFQSLEVINVCKQNCIKSTINTDCLTNIEEFFQKYRSNLHKIPDLSRDDYINLLQSQAERFDNNEECNPNEENMDDNLKNVINAFTNENVINLVVQQILNKKL